MVYKNIRNFLILICIVIWLAVFTIDNKLHIVTCDVGQGDAILIQKVNTQILIDGGPNQKVLDCLGRHMPFWDKKIELVINTHPEIDHYGGLVNVFKNYEVSVFANNGQDSGNQSYQVLKDWVGGSGAEQLVLDEGIDLGVGMIYLDILNPLVNYQSPIINNQTTKTNDNGVVVLLKYAQFKALFMADVENAVSDRLSDNSKIENVNYLKVNHHGSKNGLSQKLLDTITNSGSLPRSIVGVISVGANNSYGHPHQEIIKMLKNKDIKILRTDEGDADYVIN